MAVKDSLSLSEILCDCQRQQVTVTDSLWVENTLPHVTYFVESCDGGSVGLETFENFQQIGEGFKETRRGSSVSQNTNIRAYKPQLLVLLRFNKINNLN